MAPCWDSRGQNKTFVVALAEWSCFLKTFQLSQYHPPLRSCQTTPVPLGLLQALPRSWPHQEAGRRVSLKRELSTCSRQKPKDRNAIIKVRGSLLSTLPSYLTKQEAFASCCTCSSDLSLGPDSCTVSNSKIQLTLPSTNLHGVHGLCTTLGFLAVRSPP